MIEKYQKPAELYDGLRLHQNENTGGCSPKVLAALARLEAEQVGFYPPYEAATRACAAYLGVAPDRLSLLNGLDEGIMAIAVSYLRPRPGSDRPEAIIPGRPIRVEPNADFSFPLDRVLDEITPHTRVVFITNPNNPTGVLTPLESSRTVAARVPKEAIVFVDEAYAEFSGISLIPELERLPNVVVLSFAEVTSQTAVDAVGNIEVNVGNEALHR